jgi:hypothetical protein
MPVCNGLLGAAEAARWCSQPLSGTLAPPERHARDICIFLRLTPMVLVYAQLAFSRPRPPRWLECSSSNGVVAK